MKHYTITKCEELMQLNSDWYNNSWNNADIANIAIFRPESTAHRPLTQLKLSYNTDGLFGKFTVQDQYIRSVTTGYQGAVCQDSCVEIFLQPKKDKGYLNFEFNCGGAMLCYYITDPTKTENGFKEMIPLKDDELNQIKVHHSMPPIVEPEIIDKTEWTLSFFIPFSLFEHYIGNLGPIENSRWSGNFYKCGDKTSHPHWASWNPLTATNFHLPECFGVIKFQK